MKRVGVLGTFVWDEIWHPAAGGDAPLEQMGGLAYSLSAFSAACPQGWEVVPLARVGADVEPQVSSFVSSLGKIASRSGLVRVDEPNNRVELRYRDGAERTERLTGGVSGWSVHELLPLLSSLDALYVNFLAGNEITRETAVEVRAAAKIPIYTDLHSLFLGPAGAGPRPPRRVVDWAAWLAPFDYVQVNESELALLGPERAEPNSLLSELPSPGPRAMFVTRGAAGATLARPASPALSAGASERSQSSGSVRTPVELVDFPLAGGASLGDPTGCGDVWGSVVFCGLLAGLSMETAIARAHRAASAKMSVSRIERVAHRIEEALA